MTDLPDAPNRRILEVLVANVRISMTEIARTLGLTPPVALRVKQMEDADLITSYRAILSPFKLDLTHVTITTSYVAMRAVVEQKWAEA